MPILRDTKRYGDIADAVNVGLKAVEFTGPEGKAVAEFLQLFTQAASLANVLIQATPLLLDPQGLRVDILPSRVADDGGTAAMAARVQKRAAGELLGELPGMPAGQLRDVLVEWAAAKARASQKLAGISPAVISSALAAAGLSEIGINSFKDAFSDAWKDWLGSEIGSLTPAAPVLLGDIKFVPSDVWAFPGDNPPVALTGVFATKTAAVSAGSSVVTVPVDGHVRTTAGECQAAIGAAQRAPDRGVNGFELAVGRVEIVPANMNLQIGQTLRLDTRLVDGFGASVDKTGWEWEWRTSSDAMAPFAPGSGSLGSIATVHLFTAGEALITVVATSPRGTSRTGTATVTATGTVELDPRGETLVGMSFRSHDTVIDFAGTWSIGPLPAYRCVGPAGAFNQTGNPDWNKLPLGQVLYQLRDPVSHAPLTEWIGWTANPVVIPPAVGPVVVGKGGVEIWATMEDIHNEASPADNSRCPNDPMRAIVH